MEFLDEALGARADVVMLDNFTDEMVAAAMERVKKSPGARPLIEVSGRLTLERIGKLGALGVDILSVGSLTHGARAMDIGLDVEVRGTWKH